MQIRSKSLHGHEWSQKYYIDVPKLSFRINSRSSDSKTTRVEASRAFLVEEEEEKAKEDTSSRSRNFRSAVKGFLKMPFMEGETVRALCIHRHIMNAISHCTVHAPKRRNLCNGASSIHNVLEFCGIFDLANSRSLSD